MKKEIKLEPFQHEGAWFLSERRCALLADEPGLGKTVQALHAAKLLGLGPQDEGWVWCPASVRTSWLEHIEHIMGRVGAWAVYGYNYARMKAAELETRPSWRNPLLILDEEHFLKTVESQRTQAIFGRGTGIARRAERVWALTGTPVLNRPRELYPMLKTMAPGFEGMDFNRFTQRYCGAFFDGRGINTKGASHLDELAAKLEGFMLRRTKRQVYPDRKEPLVTRIPLELTREEMAAVLAEEEAIGARQAPISAAKAEFSQLGDTSRLLRLLGQAKLPQVQEFVEEKLETVDKVVVFAHHSDVIRGLAQRFRDKGFEPVVYHGGMSDKQKDEARHYFMQARKCRVFIGQNQSAGVGINGLQTVCSTAVLAEPSWVPGETEQMIDRLDRIGQQDDIVNAYVLYAQGTLDEVKVHVHDRKERVVSRLMGA